MSASVAGAMVACIAGIAVSAGNDKLTRTVLKKKTSRLGALFALRQGINIAYLAAVYFLSAALGMNTALLLVCAALGVTVPSIFFALRLSKQAGGQKSEPDTPEENRSEREEHK